MRTTEAHFDCELAEVWTRALRVLDAEGHAPADAMLLAAQHRLRQVAAPMTLAKSMSLRGTLAFLANELAAARAWLDDALQEIRRLAEPASGLEATTRLCLVDVYLALGEMEGASNEIYASATLASAQALTDPHVGASIWAEFAERMCDWRRYSELVYYWRQYAQHVAQRQTPWNQAVVLEGLVDAQGMVGDLEGCKATVQEILGLMAVADASKIRQPMLTRLLQTCIAFGLSDGATLVADALAVAVRRESSPAPSLSVLMQAARAEDLLSRGEAQAALDAMNAVPADEDVAAASTLACLVRARCYADLRRPAEAFTEWERVVMQWQRDDGLPLIVLLDALTGAARAQDALGRYAQAKHWYTAAADFADRGLEDKDMRRSIAAYDLAEIDRVLGLDDWPERMERLAGSERAQQRTSTRFYALLLRKLGELALESGHEQEAVARLSEAMDIERSLGVEIDVRSVLLCGVYARALRASGKDSVPMLQEAVDRARACSPARPRVLGHALVNLAHAELEQGHAGDALALMDDAASVEAALPESDDRELLTRILDMRAAACMVLGQFDEALACSTQVADFHDQRFVEMFHAGGLVGARRAMRDARHFVERLLCALSQSAQSSETQVTAAYTLVLRCKGSEARAFRLRNDSGLPTRTDFERGIQGARADLARAALLDNSTPDLEKRAKRLQEDEVRLAQSVPRERLWQHVLDVDASQVIGHMSATGAALIDVVEITGLTGVPQLVAFVVNGCPDVPIALVQLGSSEQLARLVDHLVAAIANDEPLETWQREAGVLGRLLLGGVARDGDSRELVFAPEGPLVNLPIDALVLGDGEFVLDRFACRVVLCGREALPDLHPRRHGRDTVVVGNPAFDTVVPGGDGLYAASGIPFGDLPGAQEECDVVGSLLRGATVLCGQQATRAALQALHSPELLHIATHGFAVQRGEDGVIDAFGRSLAGIADPLLRCGLAMAQANGFDPRREDRSEVGILWGTDILELDVRGTELVFLSACHSGVGDVTIGPAAGSLALAFWLAGARSIVMTRWEITDLVAAELARAFYERVVKDEPYVWALRAAKLSVKADGAAASDWAGYALLGEAKPLFARGGPFVQFIDGNKLMARSALALRMEE